MIGQQSRRGSRAAQQRGPSARRQVGDESVDCGVGGHEHGDIVKASAAGPAAAAASGASRSAAQLALQARRGCGLLAREAGRESLPPGASMWQLKRWHKIADCQVGADPTDQSTELAVRLEATMKPANEENSGVVL